MDEQNTNTAQEPKVLTQEEIEHKIQLGLDILNGKRRNLGRRTAFYSFRDAAMAGSAEGKARLSDLYYRADGTERNYDEAFRLATEAANEGNTFGQNLLGVYYTQGRAIERNVDEAFKWFSKAADKGDPDALYYLGSCYYDGRGVEKDLYQARLIFEKAANAGQPMAGGAIKMIDDLIEKNEQEEDRYQKAVRGDHDSIASILRDCIKKLDGHITFETALSEKELNIIRKAEMMDDPECEYLLSECYRVTAVSTAEEHRQKTVDSWLKHLENSALGRSYPPALHKLGTLYNTGNFVNKDPEMAFGCYLQAAERGYPDSMLSLSHCYEIGNGTETDLGQALEWAQKAYDNAKASNLNITAIGNRIHDLKIRQLEEEARQKKEEEKKGSGSYGLSYIWSLIDFNVYGILAAVGLYLFTVLFRALGAGLLTQPSIDVHGFSRFILVLISAAGIFFGIFVSLLSIFTQIGIPFLAFYPSGLLWLFLVIELHDHAQYFTYMTYFALAVTAINLIFIAVRTIRKY